MANPKRRHSNTRTRLRRSQDFLRPASLSTCAHCKAPVPPHRVCPSCGYYRGRQVLTIRADKESQEKKT